MPLSIEDRLEITELYSRQAWAMDTGDVDGYVAVFAPDGVLNLAEVHRGHAAIRRFAEAFRLFDVGLPGSQHLVSQLVLDGDGTRCSARAYVTRTYRMEGRIRNNTMIIWSGYYADTLTKLAGRWVISEQVGRAWEGPIVDRVRQARASTLAAAG